MKGESIKYYSVKEVAQYFAISKSQVYKMINEGAIGALKIGKAIKISSKDLKAFEKKYHLRAKRKKPF